MTLDKFAGLIAQNGESLMMLGGTTEQGAKQFAQLAKGIQQSGVGADIPLTRSTVVWPSTLV